MRVMVEVVGEERGPLPDPPPGIPGEGEMQKNPHPGPLPEYMERGKCGSKWVVEEGLGLLRKTRIERKPNHIHPRFGQVIGVGVFGVGHRVHP